MALINISIDETKVINVADAYKSKKFYTNVNYRQGSKGYTGGIKDELFDIIDNEILAAISENIGSKEITATNEYQTETNITQDFRIGVGAVNFELANKILARALLYCPEDTGQLKQSARIQQLANGGYAIIFDAPYAWFVHEFTWRQIDKSKNPLARHKWLEIAYQEVLKEEGFI